MAREPRERFGLRENAVASMQRHTPVVASQNSVKVTPSASVKAELGVAPGS